MHCVFILLNINVTLKNLGTKTNYCTIYPYVIWEYRERIEIEVVLAQNSPNWVLLPVYMYALKN